MGTTAKLRWTQDDENDLQSMVKRKADFQSHSRKPVIDAVQRIRHTLGAVHNEAQLVDEFINNADSIRDALAPFDSGVRVAPSDSTPG